MPKLSKNTAKLGDYTLTFSMATLCYADMELEKRGKKDVLDMFSTIAPALVGGDMSDIDLDGVDFVSFCIAMWCFLKPSHDMDFDEALEGPLSQGTPKDWIVAIFNLVSDNTETAKKGPEGNVTAA